MYLLRRGNKAPASGRGGAGEDAKKEVERLLKTIEQLRAENLQLTEQVRAWEGSKGVAIIAGHAWPEAPPCRLLQ